MTRTLTQIAKEDRRLDKSKASFCPVYDELFSPIQFNDLNILEIGVRHGASIALWEEYFPNAKIFGIDIDERTIRYRRKRINIEIVDQSNKKELKNFVQDKKFDIIIDDGSHKSSHQIISFETLWPSVKNYYIIEDVETSYWVNSPRGYVDSNPTCIEYFKNMIFEINNSGIPNLRPKRFSYYRKTVKSLRFYNNLIVLDKF